MRLGDMGLRETKISWEPVGPEVRKIRIERAETAAGPFVEIATVSASARAFADTAPRPRYTTKTQKRSAPGISDLAIL